MKKWASVLFVGVCLAISGCSTSSLTDEEAPRVAPVATPIVPSATPTPTSVPPAAPPEPQSTSKLEVSSRYGHALYSSDQSPTQIVETIAGHIRRTAHEENLVHLETEIKYKMSQFRMVTDNVNTSVEDMKLATKMAAIMEKLAAAAVGKRIGNPTWEENVRVAHTIAEAAEAEIRSAGNPAVQ